MKTSERIAKYGTKAKAPFIILAFAMIITFVPLPMGGIPAQANEDGDFYFTIQSRSSAVTLIYSISGETVSEVTNEMEYSANGTTWNPINTDPLVVSSFIPSATAGSGVTLRIRFRATADEAASEWVSIPLARRQPTPLASAVRYDGVLEAITGVSDRMQYREGTSGEFIPGTGAPIEVKAGSSVQRYQVRMAPITTEPMASASGALSVAVPIRAGQPNAVYNGSLDAITGVTTAMGYSLDGGASWVRCDGPRIDRGIFDGFSEIQIKTIATSNMPESETRTLIIPPARAPFTAVPVLDIPNEVITDVSNLMEYSTNNGTTWRAITAETLDVSSFIPSASANSPLTISIRLRAVGIGAASESVSFTLPRRQATPMASAVKYDGLSETITGISNLMEYREGSTAGFTAGTGSAVSANAGAAVKRYQVRVAATPTAPKSAALNVTVPARAAAPNATYNRASDSITNVSPAMEYSLDGVVWLPCAGATIERSAFPGVSTVQVRVAATEFRPASNPRSVTGIPGLPVPPAPLGIFFDTFREEITGVSDLMEYRTSPSSVFAMVDIGETAIKVATRTNAQTYQVRLAATATESESAVVNVTIPARATRPNPVYNASSDTIIGVTAAMMYSLNGGSTWSYCPGITISRTVFDGYSAVSIRMPATASRPASETVTVNIPPPPEAFTGVPALDLIEETVTIPGFSNQMEFSVNGTLWRPINGEMLDISTIIPSAAAGSEVRLRIRLKAVGVGAPSQEIVIVLPRRQPAPTAAAVRYDSVSELITGVSGLMEYREGTSDEFRPGTGANVNAAAGSSARRFQIRTSATATAPKSAALNITVPARAIAPNALYNSTSDAITGVSTTMEYSRDGGVTWARCTGRTITRAEFAGAAVIRVRIAVTATRPVSNFRDVAVPLHPPVSAPSGLAYNTGLEVITGVDDKMEYRAGTAGVFTPVPAGDTTITVTPGSSAQTYQVRVAEDAPFLASATRNVIIPARSATPNPVYNGSLDRITGVNASMQYSLDGGAWTSSPGTSIDRSLFDTAAVVSIRVPATPTRPASLSRDVNIPPPPEPFTGSPVLDLIGEAVTGLASDMEYSTNGTLWRPISGSSLDISGLIPSASAGGDVLLRIRTKAVGTGAASLAATITLPKRQPTPRSTEVSFNGFSERITGADIADMEFRAGTSGPFEPIPAGGIEITMSTSSQRFQVRRAATAALPASAVLNITVPIRAAAPNAVYDSVNDRITGITSAMEFSLDGGVSWTGCTSARTITRIEFGNAAVTVLVRTAAIASRAASNHRQVRVPAISSQLPPGYEIRP